MGYRSPQGLHKREADASEPHYQPALAYHPAGGYGYSKYGPGYSYTYRSPQVFTRGRLMPLSPTTSLPLPTTPLVATDTTSMVPATLTPTGAPRVFTRGRLMPLSPTTSLLLPTTPLVAMDTASTVPATLMSTGALRVFTRGRPLVPATSM